VGEGRGSPCWVSQAEGMEGDDLYLRYPHTVYSYLRKPSSVTYGTGQLSSVTTSELKITPTETITVTLAER
jgi:hypothetical protein